MSKFATKAAANMFCQARYEAAKSNERLSSREGAAEEIGIDRTRLARIELGSTIPYQEEVLLIRDTLAHDYKIAVNDKRVLRICRKKKIQSYIKHRYNCCTKPASDPAYVAENILNREFKSDMM